MQRRERGIYKFATPPGGQGKLTGWYRTKLEQGDMESVTRSIRWWDGTNYEPYYPFIDTDMSPEAMITAGFVQEHVPGNIERWMMRDIVGVTSRAMRLFERVYDSLGEDYVLTHFCPVAWMTVSNPSKKELKEKTAAIIASSGTYPIALYNVAVSDESMKQYGVSLPVVWMRRSFLRTFKTGNDLMNIYRMMGRRITDKYDIPAYREEE